MALKYKLKEIEVGDVKIDNGVKSVVTSKDPNTGAISWSIDYVPNLTKLVEDSMELASTAKGVYQKAKDDKKFLDIYEQSKQLRNTIRTHVRNNYPEDYKKSTNESVEEGVVYDNETQILKAKIYAEDFMRSYRKMLRIVDGNFGEVAEAEFKKIVKAKFNGMNESVVKEETFEDEIVRLEDTMYVDRRDGGKIFIHPLDKPGVRRPSKDYISISGNNITAVQGYNSGPIQDLADTYGLFVDKDSRLVPMGKDYASGKASLLSSNILRDAIKAIEDARNIEAKNQQDYYRKRGPVSGVGNMDEADVVAPIAKANVAKANNAITNASGVADYLLDVIDQIKDKEQDGIFNNSNIKQAINFLTKAKGVDEMSMSGGAGAYLTPYAFRLPKKKKKDIKEGAKKSVNVHNQGQQPGEDLGPGPKATEDGVKDNAYVKQFKYQLVPKNKNGTYVQKGSGLEVKKLF